MDNFNNKDWVDIGVNEFYNPADEKFKYQTQIDGNEIISNLSQLQSTLNQGIGSINSNPLFVNPSNPVGPDGIFWTSDDGFKLQEGSPACRMGAYSCASNQTIQNSTDINTDGFTNIEDVRVCMNVIINLETNQTFIDKCKAVVDDENVNLLDVKEIVNNI